VSLIFSTTCVIYSIETSR